MRLQGLLPNVDDVYLPHPQCLLFNSTPASINSVPSTIYTDFPDPSIRKQKLLAQFPKNYSDARNSYAQPVLHHSFIMLLDEDPATVHHNLEFYSFSQGLF